MGDDRPDDILGIVARKGKDLRWPYCHWYACAGGGLGQERPAALRATVLASCIAPDATHTLTAVAAARHSLLPRRPLAAGWAPARTPCAAPARAQHWPILT
jgi:glucose/arabinose dehydrogenase